jgi:hypothetical protein
VTSKSHGHLNDMNSASQHEFHSKRPSVYLDQWVWVRLAKAAAGNPRERGDDAVLRAVESARDAGVAFPLSSTHYIETARVRSHRQRTDLATIMGSISHLRTLRSRHELLRHQLLTVMHEVFGRPTFRPEYVEPLGVGVYWAFEGEHRRLTVHGSQGILDAVEAALAPGALCRATQWAELQFLAGPRDEDVAKLRERYAYRPETTEQLGASRLEWEQVYVGLLADDPVSRAELRVRVQAREIAHEHLDLLSSLLREYRLSLDRLTGGPGAEPGSARPRMTAFFDSMPSVRAAVDMKVELFRNLSNTWTINDIYDIDAVSLAIPYCHVVVADKAKIDTLERTGADAHNGTQLIRRLMDLVDALPPLEEAAGRLGGDRIGWNWCHPGVRFDPLSPEALFKVD